MKFYAAAALITVTVLSACGQTETQSTVAREASQPIWFKELVSTQGTKINVISSLSGDNYFYYMRHSFQVKNPQNLPVEIHATQYCTASLPRAKTFVLKPSQFRYSNGVSVSEFTDSMRIYEDIVPCKHEVAIKVGDTWQVDPMRQQDGPQGSHNFLLVEIRGIHGLSDLMNRFH